MHVLSSVIRNQHRYAMQWQASDLLMGLLNDEMYTKRERTLMVGSVDDIVIDHARMHIELTENEYLPQEMRSNEHSGKTFKVFRSEMPELEAIMSRAA